MFNRVYDTYIFKTPKVEKITGPIPEFKNDDFKYFVENLNKDRKKDMSFFLNNLKSLKIKRVPKSKAITSNALAQYAITNNVIEVIDVNNYKDYIHHELLHMASSTVDSNGNIYSGFIQAIDNSCIGMGLDEGYTALLDDRYFINYTKTKQVDNIRRYAVVKYLASLLEVFITQEEMEDMYFSADLLGLISVLAKYTSKHEAIQFIQNLDEILYGFEDKPIPNPFLCYKKYSECILILSEAWYMRVTLGYVNNQLTKEEYENCLEEIKKLLRQRLGMKHFPFRSRRIEEEYYPKIEKKVAKKILKKSNKKDTTN